MPGAAAGSIGSAPVKARWPWVLVVGLAWPALGNCAIFAQRDAASGAMVYSNVPGPPVSMTVKVKARAGLVQRAGFPVIARAEQQQRDRGRLAILQDELASEQQHLSDASAAGATPDVQQRHRSNIAALQRELAVQR